MDAAGKLAFVRDQILLPEGRTVGDALAAGGDRWIEEDMLGPCFATTPAGLPFYSLVYLELPRGHWKTGAMAAVALAEAVLEEDTDVVVAAADLDQAGIVLEALDGYLRRNPRLAALVTGRSTERQVEGGSRIRVVASDAASAWGLGGVTRRFRVLADELASWRDVAMWEALASSTGKTPNAMTIVCSNAGFDGERSWQWRAREAARTETWGHLFSPDGVIASWIDEAWLDQQRQLLPPATYARVILNTWSSVSGDFITADQWAACVDERLTRRSRGTGARTHHGGLDLGLTKDRSALAITHREDEDVVLDELLVWQGSREEPVSITGIERAVTDASRRYPGLTISADPWQLKGSIERLQRDRVRIREHVFSASSVQKLSTTLYGAISSAALRVYPDPELEREVLGLRVIESGSGWKFDHRSGGYSDRAVALAMAIQLAQAQPTRRPYRSGLTRARVDLGTYVR